MALEELVRESVVEIGFMKGTGLGAVLLTIIAIAFFFSPRFRLNELVKIVISRDRLGLLSGESKVPLESDRVKFRSTERKERQRDTKRSA